MVKTPERHPRERSVNNALAVRRLAAPPHRDVARRPTPPPGRFASNLYGRSRDPAPRSGQRARNLVRWLLLSFVCTAMLACGSMPPGVKSAQRLLSRGDYDGAEKMADQELARFPKHPTLWRIKIQSALARRNPTQAVELYRNWRDIKGVHDDALLRRMSLTTLWQGLRVPSAVVKTAAIQAIERLELEQLAEEVTERILDDDDMVAAAASVALLRSRLNAPYVATQLLGSDDSRARVIVVEGIGRKIGAAARTDLHRASKDSAAEVRRAVVTALASFGSSEDTALLTLLATEDKDGTVRAAALRGLARGPLQGANAAAQRALDDAYLGARLAAVYLLSKLGAESRPTLTRLVEHAEPFVALRAAVALGDRASAVATAALMRALADDSWNVRVAAINATGELLRDAAAHEKYLVMLKDDQLDVKLAAARALSNHKDNSQALAALVGALTAAEDHHRLQAAIELTRLHDPRGLDALGVLSRSPNATTRSSALRAHRIPAAATDSLVAALADESAQIRILAAEILLELTR